MHSRDKLHSYVLLDLVATSLVAAFIWASACSYSMVDPPDLSGVPLATPQLQRIIATVLLWCWGWAAIAAVINFFIIRWMGRNLNQALSDARKLAWCSALTHWLLLILPSLAPTYQFWVLHNNFKL